MDFTSENYMIRVVEKPREILQEQLALLSPAERAEFEQIKHAKRKIEFALPRLLLRELLQQNYSEIRYAESGKPTMLNTEISISHSQNFVAVMISESAAVAIDVEEFRPQILSIVGKFATKQEQVEFSTMEDLILLWSAKETLFKLTNFSPDLMFYEVQKSTENQLVARILTDNEPLRVKLSYFRNQKFCLVWATQNLR